MSKVSYVLSRKPWLLPFLAILSEKGGVCNKQELLEELGVSSKLLKTAIWTLKSNNMITVTEGGEIVYRGDRLEIIKHRNKYVYRVGKTWVVATVKRRRISAKTIPDKVLMEIRTKTRQGLDAKLISKELNIGYGTVKDALLIIKNTIYDSLSSTNKE